MDFDERLKKAIDRGQQAKASTKTVVTSDSLSAEEIRNIYSAARLNLSEHIESCLKKLTDHFPGFRFETIVGETGWGAKISRDDLSIAKGSAVDAVFQNKAGWSSNKRQNQYSRLEVLVKPYCDDTKIVNVVAKGTVRNKELVNRSNYQFISEFNEKTYQEVIDMWIVEFAEHYAAPT
jgi:hypothetical protein